MMLRYSGTTSISTIEGHLLAAAMVQPWVSKVTLTLASGATALGSVTGPYYFQTNPLQYVVMVSIFTAVICTFVVNG
jgi:cadmium resistance protein CadD (predicted permease)